MPPRERERRVGALQVLDDRQSVHHHEMGDAPGMIHSRPEGDERAAVVADDGEGVVPEVRHQRSHVPGHCTLGRLRVIGPVRRQARSAVAAQIRRDHRVRYRQLRSHRVPGRVRARVPVQQHDGRATAAVPDP